MPRNYQSPIKVNWWVDTTATKVVDTIAESARDHFEDAVLHHIQKFDIHVDRNELVKALEYDRHQYDKGYEAGLLDTTFVVRCKDCKHFEWTLRSNNWGQCDMRIFGFVYVDGDEYCSYGERKESEDGQQEETTQAENDSAE